MEKSKVCKNMICYLCTHDPQDCAGKTFENATKEQLVERLKQYEPDSRQYYKIIEVLKVIHNIHDVVQCGDDTSVEVDKNDGISDEQLTSLKDFMREQIHRAFTELTTDKPSEPSGVAPGYFNPQYINGYPSETMYGNYPGMQCPVFYEGIGRFGTNEMKPIQRERISKEEHFLMIAEAVAQRGTCLRRKFGAIIVDNNGHIVSTGYVGAPRGRQNCCDIGTCYRMEHKIPSGERYEKCRSVHAEMNAIIQASSEEMRFSTLYLVGIENDGTYTNADCCAMCKRMIINAGISLVIARQSDGTYTTTHVIQWIAEDDSLDPNHVGY